MTQVSFKTGAPFRSTDDEVAILQELSSRLNVGEVLEYEEMERNTGLTRGTNRFSSVNTRWQKMDFRDHNRKYKAVINVGYRLLPPDGRIMRAKDYQRAVAKRERHMHKLAKNTEEEGLSPVLVISRRHMINSIGTQLAVLNAAKVAERHELRQLKKLEAEEANREKV